MVSTIFLDFGADNKEIAYIGELFFKKVYCVSVAWLLLVNEKIALQIFTLIYWFIFIQTGEKEASSFLKCPE